MITVEGLGKIYRSKDGIVDALEHVSLEIPQGQVIGLFGENGAGKSTLMKSILGYLTHDGAVRLDGEPITRKNITRLSFATIEHSFFPGLTAEEHRDFYREQFPNFREKRFAGLMNFFELPMNRPARAMSIGQQNQLEVILALSQGADYIFMDEPFAGNDIFNREDFYKVLMGILEPTETIILSTHLLEEVSGFVDRIILLHKGHLIGDRMMSDLEDEGMTMMEYVEQAYSYKAGRAAKAIATMV